MTVPYQHSSFVKHVRRGCESEMFVCPKGVQRWLFFVRMAVHVMAVASAIVGVARVVSYSHLMCSSTGWEVMENIPTRFAVPFVDEKENWLKRRGMEEKDIESVMYL